jgi:hypothetical protein
MFGFRGHITNRHTGRPEPHASWQRERITTWISAVMACAFAVLAAYDYAKWGTAGGAMQLLLGAGLIGGLTYARHLMLESKRREYREALAAYEAALAGAADWAEETR